MCKIHSENWSPLFGGGGIILTYRVSFSFFPNNFFQISSDNVLPQRDAMQNNIPVYPATEQVKTLFTGLTCMLIFKLSILVVIKHKFEVWMRCGKYAI